MEMNLFLLILCQGLVYIFWNLIIRQTHVQKCYISLVNWKFTIIQRFSIVLVKVSFILAEISQLFLVITCLLCLLSTTFTFCIYIFLCFKVACNNQYVVNSKRNCLTIYISKLKDLAFSIYYNDKYICIIFCFYLSWLFCFIFYHSYILDFFIITFSHVLVCKLYCPFPFFLFFWIFQLIYVNDKNLKWTNIFILP